MNAEQLQEVSFVVSDFTAEQKSLVKSIWAEEEKLLLQKEKESASVEKKEVASVPAKPKPKRKAKKKLKRVVKKPVPVEPVVHEEEAVEETPAETEEVSQ